MHGRLLLGALVAGALLLPPAAAAAADPPATLTLSGTARDFRGYDLAADGALPRGHVDFENKNGGPETGIVAARLGADGRPVYAKESVASANTNGREPFDQWFRDTPTVNLAEPLALTLTRDAATGRYVFDDQTFYPLDGSGFVALGREPLRTGNDSVAHNFSFTVELHDELLYDGGERIMIRGDDDIWLFVDGRLALDLGGVHGPLSATADLDTLGLVRGRVYDLDLFVAERHTSASSLRVDVPPLGFPAGSAAVTAASATPTAGDALTCTASGWPANVTLSYAWERNGAPIPDADGATYVTSDGDGGHALACAVTGSRRGTATAVSAVAVAARPVTGGDPPPSDPPPSDPPPAAPLPSAAVTAGPPAVGRARSATFAFTGTGEVAFYECRLDGGPWSRCASPFAVERLRNGDHLFRVRPVAVDGRVGAEATHPFQVDFYRPVVTVGGGRLTVARGAVRPRLTCSPREGEGRGSCTGTVVVRATTKADGKRRAVVLGRARYAIAAGRSATPSVRLTRAAGRLLAHAPGRRLAVRLALDTTDRAGNRARASVVRTVALPRR